MSWASAYAKQAKSDLQAREKLLQANLPACHQLHYLQMAAEKLCKARLSAQGQPQDVLETSHAFIARPLPMIARQMLARKAISLPHEAWLLRAIRKLSRQIELLHPQVDAGGTIPANCVYPWARADHVAVAPVDHQFGIDLLHAKAGVTLIKVMFAAADELIAQG